MVEKALPVPFSSEREMELSRRSFLLGASKVGALTLLPLPLLKVIPEVVEPVVSTPFSGVPLIDLSMVNVGGMVRTGIEHCTQGVYFNDKLIPVIDMTLDIYNNLMSNDVMGNYKHFCTLGEPDVKLSVNGVSIEDDPYEIFLNGSIVKTDIVFGNHRYKGNFIIDSYAYTSVYLDWS